MFRDYWRGRDRSVDPFRRADRDPNRADASGLDEPDETHHGIPRALTTSEIRMLVDGFALAGRHVKAGGYDGVDFSCWGGHLAEQFLSPLSNRRTDEYGGSLDNRLRFCLETLEEKIRIAARKTATAIE